MADYRYQTTEEVTPEPESGGEAATAALAASGETAAVTVWRQIVGDDMICSASGNFQVGDDTHAIILDKDYPVVSVGADEIAQLWTGETLDVGELGFYYNNDPAIGAVYGSLVGADMATMLDYKLRGVEYNPVIDGRIDFNSFCRYFDPSEPVILSWKSSLSWGRSAETLTSFRCRRPIPPPVWASGRSPPPMEAL